jgi:hypothetical protein
MFRHFTLCFLVEEGRRWLPFLEGARGIRWKGREVANLWGWGVSGRERTRECARRWANSKLGLAHDAERGKKKWAAARCGAGPREGQGRTASEGGGEEQPARLTGQKPGKEGNPFLFLF